MVGARRALVTIALATIAILSAARSADAAIYWNSDGEVERANNDGSFYSEHWIEPNRTLSPTPTGESTSVRGCEGIAVDSSHLYFADAMHGAIVRADLNGGTEAAFITGLDNPCGVAVDSSHVYWTDIEAGTIGVANLDGSEAQREFITGVGEPCGVAVGGGYLYWSAAPTYKERQEANEADERVHLEDYIARVPIGGGIREKLFETTEGLCGVAVDATHLYWGGFGTTIGRAGLDGSAPEPSFISGIDRPCGVALYGSQIYWSRNNPLGREILTAPLSEPGAVRTVVPHPFEVPCGVAVDGVQIQAPAPSPQPPQSHVVSFGRQRHGKGSVTFVTVKFPQAGTFTVDGGPALRVQTRVPRPSPHVILGPEEVVLRISPKPAGRAAKALRAKLAKRGVVQIVLRIHFAAADGTTSTEREALSLKGRPHRKVDAGA